MTRPVSIVLPALGDTELFEANLPSLLEDLERRALGDEVIVVDDTGEDVLAAWLAERFPAVRTVAHEVNRGFALALRSGVEAARHDLVFSMNTDVRVRAGFLDPLVACLDDGDVFAVAPRVLLNGDPEKIESVTSLRVRDGLAELHQAALGSEPGRSALEPSPIAFAVGGTCLFRRDEFLACGGFDPMYAPFYWEDIDLCWAAWRAGKRTLYQPASVVEHHHRGTIGKLIGDDVVRAAIEKNRLLFQWKHLDGDERLAEHAAALYRLTLDAWLGDQRDELVWLNLALEQADEALKARASLPEAKAGFDEILRRSSPGKP